MKKLLPLAFAIIICQSMMAQRSSEFRNLLDPYQHYFASQGYTNLGDKELWEVFKPDSIWFNSGYFYLDYNENKDLVKVTYDITSTYDDDYQYGRYSRDFKYDDKGRLVEDAYHVWKYIEEDNYSDDSISNARRLQIPIFWDEWESNKEDQMLELIYDDQDRLNRFTFHTYYDGTNWRPDEICYYYYNEDNEISDLRLYNSYGDCTYHYKNIEWHNFEKKEFSFYKLDKLTGLYAPDFFRVSVEYSDTGWTQFGEEYYRDDWHSWGRENYIITDSSVIYEDPSYSRRELFHDEYGNPAGEIYYYIDNYTKGWEISEGELWETDYEDGKALRTTYYSVNEDGTTNIHHTEAYRYKNFEPTGIKNQEVTKPNFKAYPTIAEKTITVEQNSNSAYKAKIYNLTGSCVYQDIISSQSVEIDIEHLNTGVYYLQMVQGNSSEQIKFVKK